MNLKGIETEFIAKVFFTVFFFKNYSFRKLTKWKIECEQILNLFSVAMQLPKIIEFFTLNHRYIKSRIDLMDKWLELLISRSYSFGGTKNTYLDKILVKFF